MEPIISKVEPMSRVRMRFQQGSPKVGTHNFIMGNPFKNYGLHIMGSTVVLTCGTFVNNRLHIIIKMTGTRIMKEHD